MSRLDSRAPLVFDTRELRRQPGSMQEYTRRVEVPEEMGTDIVAVPAGSGVLVSGSVQATATGACVRCLDPVNLPVEVSFQELFAYADRAAHHHEVDADSDEAEVYELVDDLVDLQPVLRDAVVPALPFQPVCRVDCPGLCSECGVALALDPDHHHDVLDPRWAALGTMLSDDPEENRT